MLNWTGYLKFFIALVGIANPLGGVPIFLAMTKGQSGEQRTRTARRAAQTVAGVLIVAAVAGQLILRIFGISIPAFRIAGGILILLMAIDMLLARVSRAKQTPEEAEEAVDREALGVVPLGMPIIAGPASISTVILYTQQSTNWRHVAVVCAVACLVAIVVWVALRSSEWTERVLGRTGVNIFTRIMGLILAAVGVEFVTSGLGEIFPALLKAGAP